MLDGKPAPKKLDPNSPITEEQFRKRLLAYLDWYDQAEWGNESEGFHVDSRGTNFSIIPWTDVEDDILRRPIKAIVEHFVDFGADLRGSYANILDHHDIDEVFGLPFRAAIEDADGDWDPEMGIDYLDRLFQKAQLGDDEVRDVLDI